MEDRERGGGGGRGRNITARGSNRIESEGIERARDRQKENDKMREILCAGGEGKKANVMCRWFGLKMDMLRRLVLCKA